MANQPATSAKGPSTPSAQPLLPMLLEDQRQRWRRGAGTQVEVYLEQQAGLRGDDEAVLDLIYNEVLLRRENGEPPSIDEYRRRFPGLAEQLEPLLEVDHVLESGEAFAVTILAPRAASLAPLVEISEGLADASRDHKGARVPVAFAAGSLAQQEGDLRSLLRR